MAMRRPNTNYTRQGARQGIGFIWFTLVAMPVLLLSLAFSADFARIVMVNHQMRNVADAGALAGALQIEPATVVLNTDKAQTEAQTTVCIYQGYVKGVAASSAGTGVPGCSVPVTMDVFFTDENAQTPESPGVGFRTVEVNLDYSIPGLLFPRYFGITETPEVTIVKQASVCVPGEADSYTGGFCARD